MQVGDKIYLIDEEKFNTHKNNSNIHVSLGETSSTAYRGDRGKTAYDHSQSTHARTDATKVEASTRNGNIKINGTETNVYTHPSGTNPHGTTKSDVGLGNVPNVATNDQTVTYTEASSLTKLSSGEKLSVAFGKISKAITDLISHISDTTKHITSAERSNWNIAKTHADSSHARTDATKVEASTRNGNIKINGTETNVYTHPSGTNPHGTTKSDVGLSNVGNFKAVSTVASQGLSDSEKANARANIGAGTSSFSGSYNDLSNKPTIPTVGNGTVTIKQAGTSKGTFTMNQSGNTTIELTDNNTDTKVIQNAVTASDYTNWRPIIFGSSNSGTEGFSPSTVTDSVYATNTLSVQPSTGTIKATTFKGALSGNAATATKLSTARTIALTGSVTGSGTFDGSGNLSIATTTNHTHSYAGSSSAGGSATSAVKLDSSAGSATQPVYFSGGKPVATTYTLGKSVPSNAVFTDTDVRNTAGSTDTSSKIFLVGTTSQAANAQSYSDNQVYATNGQLDANKFRVAEKITLEYDSTNQCLNFNFA